MFNIGEEIVAAYLRYIEGCDFVEKNLPTLDEQGEIDVIGINLKKRFSTSVRSPSTWLQG